MDEDIFYTVILDLVREAGSVVRNAYNQKESNIMTKSSDVDLVTETDRAVEVMLVDGLKSHFPDHRFIGEESASIQGQQLLTESPTWVIDPIDGTTNFVHRMPFCCISVGLLINKKPVIGVVYNPILDELYTARKGQGAFKNGFPIRVSRTKGLNKSVVISTIGSHRSPEYIDCYLANMRAIITNGMRGHRSLGSAALNMCYVACGSCDVYVEYGIHCWDIAAGMLIVQEAGGFVIDPAGGPLDVMACRVMCGATDEVTRELSSVLTDLKCPRDD